MNEEDKENMTFITQDGLWEFNVLLQGVMNGPPTFQRVMHNLIGEWKMGICSSLSRRYLDLLENIWRT
ncbi:unnamed protein product [Didymodactylos carnosus]|uniref:Reverse transcriptase n=1 Tax=Didymodactylos carnosus TaxID=1234261 RepID=A0A814THY6_9BILA|nr:unnamed protein product [Didymodactylos carnosus]CAF1161632.1 unnamed protein product [Didymodactylos carnosus]CAF3732496.1 unnamed protein product [Didymodactylos carnosus]CAF3925213.1 unnamed protein product [Didymodactylos carnosus]